MGAVPGRGLLSTGVPTDFDVEPWRGEHRRVVVLRRPAQRCLVLGSTQPEAVVDDRAAAARDTVVARRRSGGGAVLVAPEDPVWADVWLPAGDPLWADDVIVAGHWVGEWWARALGRLGIATTVHHGPSLPAPWSRLVCFAGVGPGEVVAVGRKLVGLAQWRSRQGALFQSCAYRRWDPASLAAVLAPVPGGTDVGAQDLAGIAVGVDEVAPGAGERLPAALLDALPGGPAWDIRPGRPVIR